MAGALSGELYALISAFLGALSALMVRTQSHLLPPAAMNALRCGVVALLYWALLPFTDTLGSTSPVFGVILAVLFLKEEVSARMLAGIAACMVGVWLVL